MTENNAESATHTLKIRKQFSAPVERLFRAFKEKNMLEQWFTCNDDETTSLIELDFQVGGRYRFGVKDKSSGNVCYAYGEYIKIISNEIISMTWAWEHEPDEQETLVTFEFHASENGSELLLIHSKFPSVERKDLHNTGWDRLIEALHQLFEPIV